jgi:hypothetical protein
MKLLKRIFISLLLALCFSNSSLAQKDAPVLGQTAQLLDLLNKDYKSIDPELRADELARDRAIVISIFRSYLFFTNFNNLGTDDSLNKKIKGLRISLDSSLQEKAAYLSQSITITDKSKFDTIPLRVAKLGTQVLDLKQNIQRLQCDADLEELSKIKEQYQKEENQFIIYLIKLFHSKYSNINSDKQDIFATGSSVSAVQKSLPIIGGGLSFETYIDGLAKFLAKRIKEELTIYVIDKIKENLANGGTDDPLAEFKVILPQTTRYLEKFTADKVKSFVKEIKQYIEDDLKHILENASGLKNTPRIKPLLAKFPELDFAFEAIETLPNISKAKYSIDYFNFIEHSRNLSRWKSDTVDRKKNLSNLMFFTSLMAHSLVIIENGEPKIAGMDYIQKYIGEPNFFILYIGFLHQQNKKYYSIEFEKKKKKLIVSDVLGSVVKVMPTFPLSGNAKNLQEHIYTLIGDCSKNAEKINELAADIRKANKAGKPVNADMIYPFVDNIIGIAEKMVESTDELAKSLNDINYSIHNNSLNIFPLKPLCDPYFTIAKYTNEIARDLSEKRYSIALIKALEIGIRLKGNNSSDLELTSKIQSLFMFNSSTAIQAWHKVISEFSKEQSVISDAFYTAVNRAGVELNRIETFYRKNYLTDEIFLINFTAFKDLCQNANRANTTDLRTLKSVYFSLTNNNQEFSSLLVSYYLNISVQNLNKEIKKTIDKIELEDYSKKLTPAFYFDAATIITGQIDLYVKECYNNFIIEGNQNENTALKKAKEDLKEKAGYYANEFMIKLDPSVNQTTVDLIHFVNNIAQAQNSDDLATALNDFALPSGSYGIKRKSILNFSINAYPGVLVGREWSWTNSDKLAKAYSFSFTAPVGLNLSWGTKNNKQASNGIFLSIIDIGALTRLRLDSESTTQTLPEFSFKNIFAPGLYYSHGIKKAPISVNLGFQYGPELKEIKDQAGTLVTNGYESIRFGLGLVLDIPLFNLFTKPR